MTTIRSILVVFVLINSITVSAAVTEVDNEQLRSLQASNATIIDVRRADEWKHTGMIEGSHGVTFFDEKGRYDVEAWLARIYSLTPADQPVVLICARGVRSSKIAQLLDKRLGFTAVHNVTGGIVEWLNEKQPVIAWTPE